MEHHAAWRMPSCRDSEPFQHEMLAAEDSDDDWLRSLCRAPEREPQSPGSASDDEWVTCLCRSRPHISADKACQQPSTSHSTLLDDCQGHVSPGPQSTQRPEVRPQAPPSRPLEVRPQALASRPVEVVPQALLPPRLDIGGACPRREPGQMSRSVRRRMLADFVAPQVWWHRVREADTCDPEEVEAACELLRGIRSANGGLIIFKIGITTDPEFRMHNSAFGYARVGVGEVYTDMWVLLKGAPGACVQLERSLISVFRNVSGCRNVAPGGETAPKEWPAYTYCVCRRVGDFCSLLSGGRTAVAHPEIVGMLLPALFVEHWCRSVGLLFLHVCIQSSRGHHA